MKKPLQHLLLTLTLVFTIIVGKAQTAYITNYTYDTLSVINLGTNTIVDKIVIPVFGSFAVSASTDGSKVYVTNIGDSTVRVINTASNTVSAKIKVGNYPEGISASSDGSKVYVTNPAAQDL